jgi:hypothetical protein
MTNEANIVGREQLARALKITDTQLAEIEKQHGLPRDDGKMKDTSIWKRSTVLAWKKRAGL